MHTFRWQLRNFYFSPDEGGSPGGSGTGVDSGGEGGSDPGQAGSSQTAGAGSVASPSGGAGGANSPPAPAISGQLPGSTGADGGQTPPGQAVAPAWLSRLKEQGIGEFSDEQTALAAIQNLHRAHQQYQQLSPWVQAYQQHAAPFAQYIQSLRERQAQGQAPAGQQQGGQQKPWWAPHWNPPEYNPQWASLLTTDEHGNIQPRPGTPPEIVGKYQAYQQFRAEQAQRLMNNPYEFMEPAIKELARQEAQAIVREQMSGYSDQQRSQQFVEQNSQWLYQFDQQGRRMQQMVHNPMSGQMQAMPVLSQWGQLFAEETQREAQRQAQRGYSDVEDQKRIAMKEVQLQYLVSQLQNGQQGGQTNQQFQQGQQPQQGQQRQLTPQEQANQRFLQQNNPPAQQPASQGNQRPKKVTVTSRNLKDVMRENLRAAGINDDVLNNDLLNRGK